MGTLDLQVLYAAYRRRGTGIARLSIEGCPSFDDWRDGYDFEGRLLQVVERSVYPSFYDPDRDCFLNLLK